MSKDWRVYATYITETIQKIKLILVRGDIEEDFVLYDAILRNLQTLSEATTHLPKEIKSRYPQIEWRNIHGFRNILVHNYLGDIDPSTVKKVIANDLKELESVMKDIF